MIKVITCPNCNFSKKVPEEKIPQDIKFAKCPRCRRTFEIDPAEDAAVCADRGLIGEIPEHERFQSQGSGTGNDEAGYFKSLWQTLKCVLFSPRIFFSTGIHEQTAGEAFAFGMLFGSLGIMINTLWDFIIKSQEINLILEALSGGFTANGLFITSMIVFPLMLIMFVLFLIMFMLFNAAVFHVCLLILRGAKGGFVGTFKVSACSSSALIFCLVPVIGIFTGMIWWLVVMVIGLKEIHETSIVKVIIAFLLPMILVMIPLLIAVGYVGSLIL